MSFQGDVSDIIEEIFASSIQDGFNELRDTACSREIIQSEILGVEVQPANRRLEESSGRALQGTVITIITVFTLTLCEQVDVPICMVEPPLVLNNAAIQAIADLIGSRSGIVTAITIIAVIDLTTPAPTPAPTFATRMLEADEEDFFELSDIGHANCNCIDCAVSSGCEDLWKGRLTVNDALVPTKTHVVAFYCKGDFGWFDDDPTYFNGVQTESVTVVSRCGREAPSHLSGILSGATDILLPNDMTTSEALLSWIVQNYNEVSLTDAVIFLTDQIDAVAIKASSIVITAQHAGFGCGSLLSNPTDHEDISQSVYFDVATLRHENAAVDSFWSKNDVVFPASIVQVCESNNFATTMEHIRSIEKSFWEKLLDSNHNNMEDDLATKITLAGLLSRALTNDEIAILTSHSNHEMLHDGRLIHTSFSPSASEQVAEETEGQTYSDIVGAALSSIIDSVLQSTNTTGSSVEAL